jgi:NADPH2 dehydrogenase
VPLGARITGSDWREGGLTPDDAVALAKALKGEGLDFVCVSSGGVAADIRNPVEPGYNVPIAARIKQEAGIAARTVGMIVKPEQAEQIIGQGSADMVALARGFLDDPHWGWHAAKTLGAEVSRPRQYLRAGPKLWAPAAKA